MNLPSDPKDMNDKRAEWAAAAIDAFEGVRRGDRENSLSDLLYNLMHWAERNDFDFNIELMRAEIHYHEQTTEDESEIKPAQHLPYSGLAVARTSEVQSKMTGTGTVHSSKKSFVPFTDPE